MITDTNYWTRKGIKVTTVVSICRDELGLNPACWNHLNAAYEIAKTRIISR